MRYCHFICLSEIKTHIQFRIKCSTSFFQENWYRCQDWITNLHWLSILDKEIDQLFFGICINMNKTLPFHREKFKIKRRIWIVFWFRFSSIKFVQSSIICNIFGGKLVNENAKSLSLTRVLILLILFETIPL